MSDNYMNDVSQDEISIKNLLDFFVESWKTIVVTCLVGLLGSLGFVTVTPSQYEAIAQIQMMHVSSNTSLLGVGAEEPSSLIARLKIPSSYGLDEMKACGIDYEKTPAEQMVSLVKLSPVKGAGSMAELKIRMQSKDQAINCAHAVFENIRKSQNAIVKPYVLQAKALLIKYQNRLLEVQSLLARADKSGTAFSAVYLANRDEIKFLLDESIRLNAFISSSDTHQTKLVTPIYASDIPVFPEKKISLLVGLLGGVFLGILIVMIRKAWSGYSTES